MPKILIVEDEKSTTFLLKQALSAAGHAVSTATNGEMAVAAAKTRQPDLVIMDMSLPKMDGWEATRRIKADPATSHIPVLGVSSASTGADRDEAYNAGCAGYMTKPIEVPLLINRIAELTGA